MSTELSPEAIAAATAEGRIRIAPGDVRSVITLARTADASTFMHETSHDWLKQLLRDALHALAPDQLKADAATVRNWLVGGWLMSASQLVTHERVTSSASASGPAPSSGP